MYDVLEVCRYVIKYSNEKDYSISNLKLQKILYFIQAWFLIQSKKPCFNAKIEAWDFGPVVPKAYIEYKHYGASDIKYKPTYIQIDYKNIWNTKKVAYKDGNISDEDGKMIKIIVENFKKYSSTDLVALTLKQSPWINAYEPNMCNEIPTDSIFEYFNEE